MNKINITLKDLFGKSIKTRSVVRGYFSHFKTSLLDVQPTTVKIDFIDVEFVSRNAMHELISQVESLPNLKNFIVFENMNTTVQQMYKMVNSSLNSTKKESIIISRYTVKSIDEFNRFLCA